MPLSCRQPLPDFPMPENQVQMYAMAHEALVSQPLLSLQLHFGTILPCTLLTMLFFVFRLHLDCFLYHQYFCPPFCCPNPRAPVCVSLPCAPRLSANLSPLCVPSLFLSIVTTGRTCLMFIYSSGP